MSSAKGAFTDAFDACVERDVECVNACRFDLDDCRDGTSVVEGLVACQVATTAAKARCRIKFPPGSHRQELCIDRAQIAGFECRRDVFGQFRHALKDCLSAFGQCTGACLPGGPVGGIETCQADARAVLQADLATCKSVYVATASGCINRDVSCVQGCGDAREACNAPTNSTLLAASMACTATEKSAAAACAASNPAGSAALQQCLMAAKANGFMCRQAALQAAGPGLAGCTQQYIGCVAACPKT